MSFEAVTAVVMGVTTGLALAIALSQFFARRSKAQDAEYLRDRLLDAADDLRDARERSNSLADKVGILRWRLIDASRTLDEYETALGSALDDLEEAEEELEELEEAAEELEEAAAVALAGWERADNVATRAVNLAERAAQDVIARGPL